jgi:hypothetical protein
MSVPENKREEAIRELSLRPEVTNLLLKRAEFGALSRYFELPQYFYLEVIQKALVIGLSLEIENFCRFGSLPRKYMR